MKLIQSPGEMTRWSKKQIKNGNSIGFVPTMGFFHEGHLSLMRQAAKSADCVVVSLFVNPTQFGPNEDFAKYPRNFERDTDLAKNENVAVLFAPKPEDMYPDGFQTYVSVNDISTGLCGASRTGHFTGVTTVVAKLLNIVQPDIAVFGQKDFQQLAVIRRMVKDLHMDVQILGHPIVRESDGLAKSSRNTYLDQNDRETSLCLYRSLQLAREQVKAGTRDTVELDERLKKFLGQYGKVSLDYISFVDQVNLLPVNVVDEDTVLALAVLVDNKVRLIDNGFLL